MSAQDKISKLQSELHRLKEEEKARALVEDTVKVRDLIAALSKLPPDMPIIEVTPWLKWTIPSLRKFGISYSLKAGFAYLSDRDYVEGSDIPNDRTWIGDDKPMREPYDWEKKS